MQTLPCLLHSQSLRGSIHVYSLHFSSPNFSDTYFLLDCTITRDFYMNLSWILIILTSARFLLAPRNLTFQFLLLSPKIFGSFEKKMLSYFCIPKYFPLACLKFLLRPLIHFELFLQGERQRACCDIYFEYPVPQCHLLKWLFIVCLGFLCQ